MNSGNPAFNSKTFQSLDRPIGPPMTVSGAISKSGILFLLVILGTTFSWNSPMAPVLTMAGAIGGLIVALITIFKKTWSPVTAPIYAVLQGLFLGGISAMYNAQFQGIVVQAVMLTFGVLAAMLGLYQSRIIRVTDKLRMGIVAATAAVALYYLVSMGLSLFNVQVPLLHSSGWVGIALSLLIVGIAAFNLLLDFDLMETGAAAGAPRYMEWYCAFGLMVTLIWLYLEILRLLARLQRR